MTGLGELAPFTDDVAGTLSFYRHVLNAAPDAEWPGGGVFSVGAVKLLVHERSLATSGGPLNEDHAACRSLVEAGVELLVEPRDYAWGRSAYLRDPDSQIHVIELIDGEP